MDKWLVNGLEQDTLPLDDRGLAYGDGLFETVAVRHGECRFIADHLARLEAGCQRLGIVGVNRAQLTASLNLILEGATHATIKIIVTRGSGPRGYRSPPGASPSIVVGIEKTRPVGRVGPVRVRYCTTMISRNPRLAGIKTLNRLEQVIARSEWDDADIAEGLMSDDRGNVICGTMTNLFIVCGQRVITPKLDESGIRGIMRDKVFEVGQTLDIELAETQVTRSEIESADEMFLTNSQIGVWPVHELDGFVIPRAEMTHRIMRGLAELGVEECSR